MKLTARRSGQGTGSEFEPGSVGITIEVQEYDSSTSSLVTVVPRRHWDAPPEVPSMPLLGPPPCFCERCCGRFR
jgi:hypothetical protein